MTSPVPSPQPGRFRLTLNSDGRQHKLLNAAAILILLIGLAAFVLSLVIRNVSSAGGVAWAAITTSAGLLAMVGGLFTQMVSATTTQRTIIVTGIIAGFVGFAIGLAHGGFGG